MTDLQAGVYKGYKGGLVLVLGVAQHSETNERLITYVPLGVDSGPRMSVMPYGKFMADIVTCGRSVPRFTYIGEQPEQLVAEWYDPLGGYRGADRVDD